MLFTPYDLFQQGYHSITVYQGILKGHINDVMSLEDWRNYVNVRRGHVLEDAVVKIQKKKFNLKFPISIKFTDDEGHSEGAVDTGGPTREFFRLVTQEMFRKSSVFGGKKWGLKSIKLPFFSFASKIQ